MAGMLPGVGVAPRRSRDSLCSRCESPPSVTDARRDPPLTCVTDGDLDANALRARQRLQQKLGYLHPSCSRSGEIPTNKSSGGSNHKDAGLLGSKLLGGSRSRSQWQLKLMMRSQTKTCEQTCSVCLEDFRDQEQPVTTLSCSHKYHSDCVVPWLAANPHCPYCRRPALVS